MKIVTAISSAAAAGTAAALIAIGCGGAGIAENGLSEGRGGGDAFNWCDTPQPSLEEMLRVEREIANAPPMRAAGTITIPVYVHIITADDGITGDFSDEVVAAQIAGLNISFAGLQPGGGYNTSFRFQLLSIDRTANTVWWQCERNSPDEVASKTALRQGSADDLNLYIRDLPPGLGGYGGFPWWYAGNPAMDGPVLDYLGVPNTTDPNAAGDLATHEVGHWLGLYHTFQDGCSKKNDYVSDTPAQAGPTWGCPSGPVDTCTGRQYPGNDPTMNFMDYSSCTYQFTRNQSQRMDSMWTTYRAGQ